MAPMRGLFLALTVIVAACAPTHSASRISIVTSWDYGAERHAVWSAALEALQEIGFDTEAADQAEAEIVTSWHLFRQDTGYSTCTQPCEGRLRLRFGPGVQGVRVTMDADYRPLGEERTNRCASSGELEREMNQLILDRLPAPNAWHSGAHLGVPPAPH